MDLSDICKQGLKSDFEIEIFGKRVTQPSKIFFTSFLISGRNEDSGNSKWPERVIFDERRGREDFCPDQRAIEWFY